jgi:hypothetical protein
MEAVGQQKRTFVRTRGQKPPYFSIDSEAVGGRVHRTYNSVNDALNN